MGLLIIASDSLPCSEMPLFAELSGVKQKLDVQGMPGEAKEIGCSPQYLSPFILPFPPSLVLQPWVQDTILGNLDWSSPLCPCLGLAPAVVYLHATGLVIGLHGSTYMESRMSSHEQTHHYPGPPAPAYWCGSDLLSVSGQQHPPNYSCPLQLYSGIPLS